MSTVAIYGGSFNPPHVGHAMVSAWLLWTRQVDEVWLVPVYAHAFADWHAKTLAPFADRVAWCHAMVADLDLPLRVDEIEASLTGPSYSIDTLRALASRHPQHRFRLVVGSDALPHLPKWRDWDGIARDFDPIVVGRAGYPGGGDVAFPDVSSTEIRERLARGEPVDGLVSVGVAELIQSTMPWGTKSKV